MNERRPAPDLVDRIALELQRLRAANSIDDRPLLRVDNRRQAEEAPYQFDIVRSVLHRTHCSAIPKRSRTALYALWDIQPDDLKYACPRCKPAMAEAQRNGTDSMDLLYGLLSVLDQFSAILSERGREFRASERGKQMEATVTRVIDELDHRQRESADIIVASIDGLIRVMHDLGENGSASANDEGAGPSDPRKANGRAPGSGRAAKRTEPPLTS